MHGTGRPQFFAFGAAPDLALLLGAGSGLARGQLHPRAVGIYNALHRRGGRCYSPPRASSAPASSSERWLDGRFPPVADLEAAWSRGLRAFATV